MMPGMIESVMAQETYVLAKKMLDEAALRHVLLKQDSTSPTVADSLAGGAAIDIHEYRVLLFLAETGWRHQVIVQRLSVFRT